MPNRRSALYTRVMFLALLSAAGLAMPVLARAQAPAAAATLKAGDPAPALATGKWIKGEPVTKFESGKIYVVEFWATWCGPCRASIPHLSKLQQKYPAVTFIGQDSLEDDASAVADFVKNMGDKMNYRVVLDDVPAGSHDGKMVQTWLQPSGSQGIPTAFVVGPDGKLAWIGHPMELERILEPLVAGKFDAKKEAEQVAVREALTKEIGTALRAGKTDVALAAIDKLIVADPYMAKEISVRKFMILLQTKDFAAAYSLAKDLSEANKDDSGLLNQIAWVMVDPDQTPEKLDLALAQKIAERANQIEKGLSPEILDTLANVNAAKGDLDTAITLENRAIGLTKDDQIRDALQSSLDRFKSAQKAAKAAEAKPAK